MVRTESTVFINAPIEKVYAVFRNTKNFKLVGIFSDVIIREIDNESEINQKIISVWGRWHIVLPSRHHFVPFQSIEHLNPPEFLQHIPFIREIKGQLRFLPHDSSTRVTDEIHVFLKGWGYLLSPLIQFIFGKGVRRQLLAFKNAIEMGNV